MSQPSSPSPSPKPVPEQITEIVINLLFVSSCGYTLFNVFTDNIPKALISLAISAIAGLASSFSEGLTETLKDKWKKRGQRFGEVLDKPVDRAFGTIFPKPQYLEALKAYCYDLEVEGLKGDFPSLGLEEVFVPLSLNADPAGFSSVSPIKKVWSLLPKQDQTAAENRYRRIAIVANPGYGKTTLTRYLTLKYANLSYQEFGAAPLLPILLVLRSFYGSIESEQIPMLPDLVEQQVKKMLPLCKNLDMSAAWFEKRLENGQCLVMLDGLDEVPEAHRRLVSQWINWQMQTYPSQFILTSRPHGYDESLFRGVERISIVDFNLDQKEDFIHKWYKAVLWNKKWESHWQKSQDRSEYERLSKEQAQSQSEAEAEVAAKDLIRQIIETPNLNELAKNPLLITIIAATHRAFAALPKRRVEIYKKMFNLLLADRPNFRDTPLTIRSSEENQQILQQLALTLMMSESKTEFSLEEVNHQLKTLLTEYDAELKLTPKKFLKEIQQIAGLLTGEESNLYQFSHKTFQEYLAAAELKKCQNADFLIKKIADAAWKDWEEVIRFYAAMADITPFIETLLETNDKDALLLAYRIGTEDSQKVSPALKSRLYQSLQQVNLGNLNAKVKLEEQFQTQVLLNQNTIISSQYITWKEYQLFLEAQKNQQFHSNATVIEITERPLDSAILNISWHDARWFCAWLNTQTYLQPDVGVYLYRLPTQTELSQVRSSPSGKDEILPWTSSPTTPGNALRVVRVRIDNQYRALVNFLANGRWKEADQETERLMLELTRCENHLTVDSLREFPEKDLYLIDQLWLRFSGDKFGFSVQKKIWLEVGGKLDFGDDDAAATKAFTKLSEQNGWRAKKEWLKYSALDFSIHAPSAHLPTLFGACRVLPKANLGKAWIGWCAIFSRLYAATVSSSPLDGSNL
ncbi:GUN4 domain-containing protein [Kovacikia minuta CCNUW1]|uniref:GUN4 domain-containing protein n=1 Tax=Kovacikia minuta TaxID=2931930 RepID=UPI001CCC764C|nr:GUN4 domain-containing protein [Kovacikia minuta]UBF25414.1 GUN4 domain-containing protein [Kovacikia minuta CCNUW1]